MKRKGKGRRRGNKAVWPYIHSRLIQTKKEKRLMMQDIQDRQLVQMVQMINGSAVTTRTPEEEDYVFQAACCVTICGG